MAKRRPNTVNDQVNSTQYHCQRATTKKQTKSEFVPSAESRQCCRLISYIPGVLPKEELEELPRLHIRGMGGRIKIDLGGLGIRQSSEDFAFEMPDESLSELGIRRGDIAIVQPHGNLLRSGNILAVDVGAHETLRLLTRRGRLWGLKSSRQKDTAWLPIYDLPILGVVVGVLRMFVPIFPVRSKLSEAYFAPPRERRRPNPPLAPSHRKTAPSRNTPKIRRPKQTSCPDGLVAEKASPWKPSGTESGNAHLFRANTR